MESANWKKQKVQLRRGTAAEWALRDTLLLPGEPGYEADTGRIKIGDGLTRWTALGYWGSEVPPGDYGQVVVGVNGEWTLDVLPSDIGAASTIHTHDANAIVAGTLADARLSSNVVFTTDARLSNAREWSADTISQAEAEAGTAATRRAFTAQRVFQAIAAWWNASSAKTKLDGIASGATANSTDTQLRDRATHTGTQAISTVSGLQTALDGKAASAHVHSGADITTGTIAAGRLPLATTSTAGVVTYGTTAGTACQGNDSRLSDARTPLAHTHDDRYYTETEVDTLLAGKQAAGTYATLVNGTVPASQLPSYVDDVLEYSSQATFPATGEAGKVYVSTSANKVFRWSGTTYIEIVGSPGSTDAVPEGTTNLYFTTGRASAAAPVQSVAGKTGTVTLAKADVGLSNVDNTSDANKPISAAAQTALDLKAPLASPTFTGVVTVPAGTAALPAIVSATGTAGTGVWFPGADTIAVSTGGIQRVRVTSAGRTLVAGTQSFKAERTSDLGLVAQSGMTVRGLLENGSYPETAVYGIATCRTAQVMSPAVGTLLLRFHWPIGARIRWRIRGSNFNGGDSAYSVDWQTYSATGWTGQDKSLIASGDPTFKQVRILQDANTGTTRLAYLALGATTTGWGDDIITIDADVGWSGGDDIDWSQCQWSMVANETGLSVASNQSATVEPGRIYGRSLVAVDGTAALPTFAWNADQDTGVFSPAANTWAVSAGGVERLRVAAADVTIRDADGVTERHKWLTEEGTYYATGIIRAAISLRGNYSAGATDVGVINFRNAADALVGRMDCSSTTAGSDTKGVFRWQTSDGAGVGVTRALLDENGLELGDGSDSLPSLSNIGDTDTGIWFPAANTWAVSTAGIERLRVDAVGNVRLGTQAGAAATFDIQGSSTEVYPIVSSGLYGASRPSILVRNASNTTGSFAGHSFFVTRADATGQVASIGAVSNEDTLYAPHLVFTVRSASNNQTERMRISATGNVGIGTSSPSAQLHVAGSAIFGGTITVGGTTSTATGLSVLGASSTAAARTALGLGSLATITPTGTASSTTYLRGDGTWAAVSGSGGGSSTDSPSFTGQATFTAATSGGTAIDVTGNAYFNSSLIGGSNHVTIRGNTVGLNWGTLSFTARVGSADQNIAGFAGYISANSGTTASGGLVFYSRSSAAMTERMRLTDSGRLGIGTTGPTSTLHVIGTATVSGALTAGTFSGTALAVSETRTSPVITTGILTLNAAAGSVFVVQRNAAITTIVIQNVPSGQTALSLTLLLVSGGTFGVTWNVRLVSDTGTAAAIKWANSLSAPTLTSVAGKVDVITLMTYDNGATWLAFIGGQGF